MHRGLGEKSPEGNRSIPFGAENGLLFEKITPPAHA